MRFTALRPPPPTPITLMRAPRNGSSEKLNLMGLSDSSLMLVSFGKLVVNQFECRAPRRHAMSRDSHGATEPSRVLNVEPKTRGLKYSSWACSRENIQHRPPFRRSITVDRKSVV